MTVKTEVLARQGVAKKVAGSWRGESVILLYALGFALLYNHAFWSMLLRVTALEGWHGLIFHGAALGLVTAFFFLVLALLLQL